MPSHAAHQKKTLLRLVPPSELGFVAVCILGMIAEESIVLWGCNFNTPYEISGS